MPDPELDSTNCDGETSTIQIGVDLGGGFPNTRLAVVKRDNRTIVNDDALTAPGNNGDLPGGLKVNLCSEDAEQPYAARITAFHPSNASGTLPIPQGGTATVPAPAGSAIANAIRIQDDALAGDCGLLVAPPKFSAIGSTFRQSIVDNEAPNANSGTVDGPKIATIALVNVDTVRRLFRIKGRFSLILEIDENNAASPGEPINLAQIICASKLNTDPTLIAPNSLLRFVGGGDENSRVATINHPAGNFSGFTVNDQREFVDEVILDAGQTGYVHYYTRTIRLRNFKTTGSATPQRGVQLAGVSIEEVFAVGGA